MTKEKFLSTERYIDSKKKTILILTNNEKYEILNLNRDVSGWRREREREVIKTFVLLYK